MFAQFSMNFKLQKRPIHNWIDIVENISFDNIYKPDQLNERRNKSKHSEEDAEQNEIIKNLQIKYPSAFIFKEFPIFLVIYQIIKMRE